MEETIEFNPKGVYTLSQAFGLIWQVDQKINDLKKIIEKLEPDLKSKESEIGTYAKSIPEAVIDDYNSTKRELVEDQTELKELNIYRNKASSYFRSLLPPTLIVPIAINYNGVDYSVYLDHMDKSVKYVTHNS